MSAVLSLGDDLYLPNLGLVYGDMTMEVSHQHHQQHLEQSKDDEHSTGSLLHGTMLRGFTLCVFFGKHTQLHRRLSTMHQPWPNRMESLICVLLPVKSSFLWTNLGQVDQCCCYSIVAIAVNTVTSAVTKPTNHLKPAWRLPPSFPKGQQCKP